MRIVPKQYYLPQSMLPDGFSYPSGYRQMVAAGDYMVGLRPWNFTSQLTEAAEYFSAWTGLALVPFAQAYGEDLLAFFEAVPSDDPPVVVVLLTAEWERERIAKRLKNFDAWIEYAKPIVAKHRFEHGDEEEEE